MNIPVPHIDRWTDFARKTLAPPPDVSAELKPGTVEHIERTIGYPFKRPHLLAQALVTSAYLSLFSTVLTTGLLQTHASIQGHEMTCYERLEFIGDAILDFRMLIFLLPFFQHFKH